MRNAISRSLAAALLVAGSGLAGCKVAEEDEVATETEQAGSKTVAAALAEDDNLGAARDALEQAGLLTLLDGVGSYTLLAPNDTAFEGLGPRSGKLMQEDQRPVLVAVLREHILPGHVTTAAIAEAIEQQGNSVKMTTVGGGQVSFAREGERITATGPSGNTVNLVGEGASAGNGALLTLDGVLMPAASAERSADQ